MAAINPAKSSVAITQAQAQLRALGWTSSGATALDDYLEITASPPTPAENVSAAQYEVQRAQDPMNALGWQTYRVDDDVRPPLVYFRWRPL